MLPKIAVITPVLNSANSIEKAIQSVLNQEYPQFEYIILDGLSTDGTDKVIRKYIDKITFYSQKDDGPADAYNFAIKKTDADIIAMLSADDWLEPGILNAVGQAFSQNPAADIVSTRTHLLKKNKDGRLVTIREFGFDDLCFDFKSVLAWPLTNARFYRKRLFEKNGYFKLRDDENAYYVPADTALLLRFALQPIINVRLDILGYNFLCHESSLTMNSDFAKKNKLSRQLLDVYEELFIGEKLDTLQQKLLLKHHARELVYIVLRSVRTGDVSSFMRAYQQGVKKHGLKFLLHAISSVCRILRIKFTKNFIVRPKAARGAVSKDE